MLEEKSQSEDSLEVLIIEIERQEDKKVKIIRSSNSSEYCGKYNELEQNLGPFAKLLKKRGICTQYIMLGTLQHNGVIKRCNSTLMDMVMSMLSHSYLPLFLWIDACLENCHVYIESSF